MSQSKFDHWPPGVPTHLPPVTRTLDDNLRRAAAESPDKTALIYYGAGKTYAALDVEVTKIAAYLQTACGVAKGDRVGLYMQNAPQFIAAFYGVIRAGAIVVPINAMHRSDEVAYICNDAEVRTVLTAQDVVDQLLPLITAGELEHVIAAHYAAELLETTMIELPDIITAPFAPLPAGVEDWAEVMAADLPFDAPDLAPDDLCALPYTSGSTGRGKGCVHTHRTALQGVDCIAAWFGYGGDEVHLGATPMFHIVGMQGIMNVAISTAATFVIMSRWDRKAAASLIKQNNVTSWSTVPTAVIDLLNTEGLVASDLRSMRLIFGGGSAMPEAVAARLKNLTGLDFVEVYGMTETMGLVTNNPVHAPKAGCVGIPAMQTEVRLLDPDTLKPVALGEVGEVVVCAPQVMLSYWKNVAANTETFLDLDSKRFLRTGDLACEDAAGNLYIVDRLKRMINASGYKVWPAEVETRPYQHPAIAEVCVISAKDVYRGETVKAVAVLRPGMTLEAGEFAEWAQTHMAAYKVPRLLEIVESLPKSAAGKVLWRILQDQQDKGDLSG